MVSHTRSLIIFSALFLAIVFGTGAVAAQTGSYKRSTATYTIPDVTLTNQEALKIRLRDLIQSNKVVVVDFIFGTCTTICPIMSAGYSNLQMRLGADSEKVQLVSITIDPDHDTPKIMKDYLKRYRAKPGWDFLTGSRGDIDKVLKAFDASIPNKMSHYPLTLIRSPKDGSWTRLFGLLSTADFLTECRKAGI